MSTQSRKQREIAERHGLFLTIARSILLDESYQCLSMDRIAELAEYSKGTVYQHFHCKEEILIQVCNQNANELSLLFSRAARFSGNHRERMLAVFYAHDLYSRINPGCLALMQNLGADPISTKVSAESFSEYRRTESGLIGIVSGIVSDAIKDQDLPLSEMLNPVELVYSLWSLSYGGQLIQTYDIPLKELGVSDAGTALRCASLAMLDGLLWRPLSAEFDYKHTINRVAVELFNEETNRLMAAK